jgi:small subunit ribosomal protein S21
VAGTVSAIGEQNQEGEGDNYLEVKVYGNDIEKALKALKRQIQKDGLLKEIKKRKYYEKPSVKEKRKRKEALEKRLKAMKYKRRG